MFLFTKKKKNFLSINFQFSFYITNCKYKLEYLNKKIVDTFQIKKKEKVI